MTQDQRRRRPEHHVVHDYANLVSAGKMVITLRANMSETLLDR